MRLAPTEVYEVATFYHHFDVVKEGDTPPPPLTVRVCDSLSCELAGAHALMGELKQRLGPACASFPRPASGAASRRRLPSSGRTPCRRRRPQRSNRSSRRKDTECPVGKYVDYAEVPRERRLRARRGVRRGQARCRERHQDDGGIGPARPGRRGLSRRPQVARVRSEPAPRLMAINIDEGEPGTFKDRYYLERDPHRFIEGALIAAWAVQIAEIYIYLRDEYAGCREILERELTALRPIRRARCRRSTCGAARAPTSAAKSRR